MLSPVIMIGCGGSGSKAVRYARDAVTRRLREVGWTDPMPDAWTFLGLDFNVKQEDIALIPPLPPNDFVELALDFEKYHGLYDVLLQSWAPNSDKYRQHLLGWLPERNGPKVTLTEGAGQFRAVGRAAGLYGLKHDKVRSKLSAAFDRAGRGDGLASVSNSLTGSGVGNAGNPIVLVCASMAGGTGAGVALDVVDLVRRINRGGQDVALLLFTNDIFGNDQNAHMAGNSMAVLSELVAGCWNSDVRTPGPGDIFVHTEPNPGHGPASVWVVSSKGMRLARIGEDNNEVYQAVGEALSGWVTDLRIQTEIKSWLTGNMQANATLNNSGYPFNVSQPGLVSSFGAAVVTVGRGRFQRWAQDLLGRAIVEALKDGHDFRRNLSSASDLEETESKRVERIAYTYWRVIFGDEFPERVELEVKDWKGLALAEDVFLPGNNRQLRDDISAQLEDYIAGWNRMAPDAWVASLKSAYDSCVSNIVADAENVPDSDVHEWAASTMEHMSKAVSYVLARTSCAVVIRCIKECDTYLRDRVNDLKMSGQRDVASAEAVLNENRQRLKSTRGRIVLDRNDSAVRGAFDATVNMLVQGWYSAREGAVSEIYKLAVDELNASLRQLLYQAEKSVAAAFERRGGEEPSEVEKWPRGVDHIPEQYLPSSIELPLEGEDEWKALLQSLCKDTCTSLRQHELPVDAARIMLVEGDDTARVRPLIAVDPEGPAWRPGHGLVSFICDADSVSVSDRVQAWMNSEEFGAAVREGIRTYLEPGRGHETGGIRVDYASRRKRFRDRLEEAIGLAQPLVEIDETLCGLVYGGGPGLVVDVECSQLPFGVNDPWLADAQAVFDKHVGDGRALTLCSNDPPSVLVTGFISNPLHPMVIRSITDPIADVVQTYRENGDKIRTTVWNWKRARALMHAVAVPPEALKSMIRGFAIARLCGYITVSRLEPVKISGSPKPGDERVEVEFPWPLLSLVKTGSEILPALLESFVQCYAEVGTRGLDAFEAYRRLFELGDRADPAYLSDVERMLEGQELSYCCVATPRISEGKSITERRSTAIAYLQRNIELFSRLEHDQLTGRESRSETGYAIDEEINNVALREILPLARECYEEVVTDVGQIGMAGTDDPA